MSAKITVSAIVLSILFVSATSVFADNAPTTQDPSIFTSKTVPKVDNASGAMTQRISLDVPPGRNGLQPMLALEYSSQNTSDGIVGYGWSLSIPYIQRINKTGSQDLYNGATSYFTSSLDGELANATTTNTTLYRPRVDEGAFNSYSYATSTNTWTMYDKKGTRYLFGSSDQSRQATSTNAYTWYLEEIRDTNDNYVSYTYTKDGNQVYPSLITYTGHGVTDGIMTVSFASSTRPDPYVSYRPGFKVTTSKRITQITASVNGSWVMKYDLAYASGNNGVRSMLESVTQTGRDESAAEVSLPPTVFSYVSSSTPFVAQGSSASSTVVKSPAYVVSDANGDGVNDVTTFYMGNDGLSHGVISYQVGSGGSPAGSVAGTWANESNAFDPYPAQERRARFLDVNGDGFPDVAIRSSYQGLLFGSYSTSTGYTWASTTPVGVIPEFGYVAAGMQISGGPLGDINGDGFTDFVYDSGPNSYQYQSYFNNTSGWDAVSTTTLFMPYEGIPDDTGTPVTNSQLVDINADGLDDWVFTSSTSTYVRLNNGLGWNANVDPLWTIATSTLYPHAGVHYDRGARFMDINGDGLVDFVRAYLGTNMSAGTEIADVKAVYLNTGAGWATSTAYTLPGYIMTSLTAQEIRFNEYINWQGNGQHDQDVLKTVTYSSGGKMQAEYTRTAQTSTNKQLPTSLLTVTAIGVYDNNGTAATTTYAYTGGKLYLGQGPRERKFAGFSTVTETKPDAIVKTYYSRGDGADTAEGERSDTYAHIGHVFREDISNPSTLALVRRTFYRWDADSIAASSTLLHLGRQITENYSGGESHIDTAADYIYATSTQDLIIIREYGRATSNSDGTFTNINDPFYATGQLDDGLIAYWKLDESSGVAANAVSGANVLTNNNVVTYSPGKLNNGANFSSVSSQSLSVSDANQTGLDADSDYSFSTWVKFASTPASGDGMRIISKMDNTGANINFGYTVQLLNVSGTLYLYTYFTDTDASGLRTIGRTAWTPSTGTWYHVAVIIEPSTKTIQIYINGSSQTVTYDVRAASHMAPTNVPFALGTNDISTQYLNGSLDETGVWNRLLSGGDVSALYNSGVGLTYPLGALVDLGVDDRTTVLTYAASSSVNMSVPIEKRLIDGSSATTTNSRFYYDSMAYGSVALGNMTKEESWITGTRYASTTKMYDSYGLVATSTDALGNATGYTKDAANMYVATSTNALSQATGYIYNYANGKVKQSNDSNGRLSKSVFDGLGRLTLVSQSDTATPSTFVTKTAITYTDSTTTPSIVQTTQYLNSATSTNTYEFYDGLKRLIQKRQSTEYSATSSVSDITYNTAGLVASKTLPYFSLGTSKTAATSTTALYSYFTYDPLQRPLTEVNVVGTTTNAYDAWTTITTDANGNIKHYRRDAHGNLAAVDELSDASVETTLYSYTAANALKKIFDASGNVRNFTYDGLQRRLTAEDLHAEGDGAYGAWSYAYDDGGNIASTTDPSSQVVEYTYDALNRPLTENFTGTAGTDVSYTYDSCTNGIGYLCIASSSAAQTSNAYDILGRISTATTTISSVNYATSYTYDRQGNPIIVTYPDARQVQYMYGLNGQPSSVQTRSASTGSFSSVVDTFHYAPTGKRSFIAYPSGIEANYVYDADELYRLTRILTGKGPIFSGSSGTSSTPLADNVIAYWKLDESSGAAADASNHSNGLTNNNTVTYSGGKYNNGANFASASSQSLSISDASQTGLDADSNYSFATWVKFTSLPSSGDSMRFISKMDNASGSNINFGYTVQLTNVSGTQYLYVYFTDTDASGLRTIARVAWTPSTGTWYHIAVTIEPSTKTIQMYIDGSAQTVSYVLQNASHMAPTSVPLTLGTNDVSSQYLNGSLDETGIWTRILSGSEVTDLYNAGAGAQYPFGTTTVGTSVQTGYSHVVQDISYVYDAVGNIINLTNAATSTGTAVAITFTYDDLNRLTSASTTAASSTPFRQTYSYDGIGNIANKSDIGAYSYSTSTYANPHAVTAIFLSGATTTYAYDNNGNLTTAGTSTSYTWDYRNRLTQTGGIATSTYGYDANNQRVFQHITTGTTTYPIKYQSISGATTTDYIYLGDELIATITADGISTTTRNIHADHLGSTNIVTNSSGAVVQALDYYPYGSERLETGTDVSERQYIGQFFDEQSRLSYLQARYYEAARGQFLSEDPVFLGDPKQQNLTDPQSLNSYSYANDNPIVHKDPTGKCIEDGCVIETLALIGGGIGLGGRYFGDVIENRADGVTGIQAFYPRSSAGQYVAAAGTGAAATAASAYSLLLAATIGAGGYALDNQMAGQPFNPWKTAGVGALSLVGGKFFEWGVGNVPASLFLKQATVGSMFDMNTQVILQNFFNSAPSTNNSSAKTNISNSVTSQQSNIGRSTAGGSSQGSASTAYLAGQLGVGNTQGAFVGTYNFGSGAGTYNFGSGQWQK